MSAGDDSKGDPIADDGAVPARGPFAPNPYQKPSALTDPDEPLLKRADPNKPAGLARRLAGGMMILNGVLVLVGAAVLPTPTDAKGLGSPAFGFGPAIIDLILGGMLLSGSQRLITWTILRAAVGLTAGAALRASEGPVMVVYQALLCGALLGLLIGEAGRVRTAIAGSVTALCLLVEMVSIAGTLAGGNPLAAFLMMAQGDLEPNALTQASGREAQYSLSFPGKRWYQRKADAAAKDNAAADRWFMRPDLDAHVIVIAEQIPGQALSTEAYADAVIANLKKEVFDLKIEAREPWPAFPGRGKLLTMRGTRSGMQIQWHSAILTAFDRAFYLVGFATPENMATAKEDIRAIFDSLSVPEAVLKAMPPELDPTPISTVRGAKNPYSITAPEGWFLRKEEATRKENALIDRWLTRPELDAHVLVIAEEVPPGMELPLDKYVEVVLDNAKKDSDRYSELARTPWAKFPKEGVRARVSLARGGIDLEYEYGLFTRRNRGYQIVAFTTKANFPAAKDEIARAVESFEPPP